MASAPIIISRRSLGGPQSLPSLATGERLLQAEVGAAREVAQADIQGMRQETAAQIGVDRAIAGEQMKASEAQTRFAGALDKAVTGIGNMVLEAVQQTDINQTQAKRAREKAAALQAFEQDPDWKAAPEKLRQRFADIDNEAFKGFGQAQIASMKASTLRSDLAMERQITQHSIGKMNNAGVAALTETRQQRALLASRATSAAERAGILEEDDRDIEAAVTKGMLEPTQAQAMRRALREQLDQTDFQKGLARDPAATLASLADTTMYPTFTEAQRTKAIELAKSANETLQLERARDRADRDPVGTAATYVRAPDATTVSRVVRTALIPGESSGNPNAQSNKGAAGITQFMPDTARGVARQLGWSDLNGLDDEGVRAWLKQNPERAIQMTEKMIGDDWKRYGNLAAAFAAYHAGRGGTRRDGTRVEGADDWAKAAEAKFGPAYTAAEFISMIPATRGDGGTTTRAYVAGMMQRAGADLTRGGVGELAAYRIADVVEAKGQAERQRISQDLQRQISLDADQRDTIVGQMKEGLATDPAKVAAVKIPLMAAAAQGNVEAIKELRRIGEMEENQPFIEQGWRTPPAVLERVVSEMRAAQATAPATPQDVRRLQVFEGILAEVDKQKTNNPHALMERTRQAEPTNVTIPAQGLPSGPEFASEVARSAAVGERAVAIFGADRKVFKPQAAEEIKRRWDAAMPGERFETLRTLAAAIPDRASYRAAVKQIAGDSAPAVIAGLVSLRDPDTARLIVKGVELMGQSGVDAKASELRPALEARLGTDVFKDKGLQAEVIDAAQAYYVAKRAGVGALYAPGDIGAMESALEAVTGPMISHGGVKVPLPHGQRAEPARRALRDLSVETLGTQPHGANGEPLDIEFLRDRARLRPLGFATGLYAVATPGKNGTDAAVFNDKGQPLVIDLPALAKRYESLIPQTSRDGFQTRYGAGLRALSRETP